MSSRLSFLVQSEHRAPSQDIDRERSASRGGTVVLSGWHEGLRKISASRLLQASCGLSLGEAHRLVDRVLDGEEVAVETPANRAHLVAELTALGLDASAP